MDRPAAARKLAAARDLAAVLAFLALAFLGGRALLDAPQLQKERVSRPEAERDIAQFFAVLEKERPGAADYAVLKASASAAVASRLDEFSRVSVRDLAWALAGGAAALRDSGTAVLWRPPRRWKDPEQKYPPFSVALRYGKFVVDAALDPGLAGAEVLELNGAPFRTFIAPALARVSGETAPYREYLFCRGQAAWWDFSSLLAGLPAPEVRFKARDGRVFTRRAAPITGWEFRRLAWRPAPPGEQFYSQKKVAWFNAPAPRASRRGRGAWDRFLRGLEARGMRYAVVDLRDAAGPDDGGAAYPLGLLAGPGGSGLRGRLTLLTGPGSGPAAAAFAAGFRALGAGKIAGEATGGTAGHYGAPKEFRLEASGIRFSASSRRFPGPDLPVQPDLPLTEALLRPWRGDARAFVLEELLK
ncbi:MAG: hypothetical protein M0025_06105 [Elusimicrobia bacterium]|nr:hypothetical protein [Elusimicrobiota bacterium]